LAVSSSTCSVKDVCDMSSEEFIYRYKEVSAVETKTLVQKNSKDHSKDLNVAIEDIFKSDEEITIISSDKKAVTFNKSLLILFSKSMRSCLATFSCCSFPTIFLPDCSAESVIKVHDILVKQVTKSGTKSFKDANTVVETARALGIEVDVEFGASVLVKPRNVTKNQVVTDANFSDDEEADATIQEINSLKTTLGKSYKNREKEILEYNDISDYSSEDDDDDNDNDDDRSSSDGEVDQENEAKTVSELVAVNKKADKETVMSEDENSEDDSDDEAANKRDEYKRADMMSEDDNSEVDSDEDVVNERDEQGDEYKKADKEYTMSEDENSEDDSDDEKVNKRYEEGDEYEENMNEETINYNASGISVLEDDPADDSIMNTSTVSEQLDEVLDFHNDVLRSERSKLNYVEEVQNENITKVGNFLESLKADKDIIDGKLNVLLSDQNIETSENDIGGGPSPLKDEINNVAVKKEEPLEEKFTILSSGGNEFEERFRCTICHNVMRKFASCTFKEHYSTAHFQKEIFEMYIRDTTETKCRLEGCGKDFGEKNRGNLVRHIGSTHNKSVEILQLKGMEVPMVLRDNKRKRSDVKPEKRSMFKKEADDFRYKCLMCEEKLSSKSNLDRHMMKEH